MDYGNWFKSYVIQVLPVMAFVIYLWGFAYYIAYYHEFGLDIINYVSLNEVLVNALVPVVIAGLFVLWMRIADVLINSYMTRIAYSLVGRRVWKKLLRTKNRVDRLNETIVSHQGKRSRFISGVLLTLIIVMVAFEVYCSDEIDLVWKLLAGFFVLCCVTEGSIRCYEIFRKRGTSLSIELSGAIALIIVVITIGVFCCGVVDARRASESPGKYVSITLVNGDCMSSGNVRCMIYIGETGRAVFMYDPCHKTTQVINREAIVSMSIKNEQGKIISMWNGLTE